MTCHILRLPVEILQHIADVGRLETASLRLACKAFDAAYLDKFCRDYLSDIHCFVLDPARLQKLKDVTSKPYLVRRMPKVTLTLDPLENSDMDEISTVVNASEPGLTQVYEVDHETQQFRDSMYRRRDIFEHYCVGEQDLDLMTSVIEDLKAAQCPTLSLNLDERQRYTGTLQHADVSTIYNIVMRTKCKLAELHLGNLRVLHRADFDNDTLAAFHKDLKTFCLWTCEDDIQSQVKRAWAGGQQLIRPILRDVDGLEVLSISGVGHGSRHYNGIALDLRQVSYVHFVKMVFNANSFSTLRDIDLFGVDIDVEDLRKVLMNCSKTLKVARLEYLLLTGDPGAITQIIKLLHDQCLDLGWVKLSMLSEEAELVIDTTPHVSHAKLYQSNQAEAFTAEATWEGRGNVVEGLRRNLERGITFFKD